ncbi:helix-turn-helix domain-containing protein [Pararhizobium sp. DWP3-4]|uniref:helix-turn-helix domain-containing protein n=1 Tax=Pararhizobium sp. DWP3-4 TaxID=2804565 RepID=UPI003CF77340
MSNARFSIVPAWIITDSRLKGSDLKVLCLLGSFTNKEGWCRRSQVKMADELGCGRSTVQASLSRLYEIGVVEKREIESADGRDSAHWYRVIHDRAVSDMVMSSWNDGEVDEEYDPIAGVVSDAPPAFSSGHPLPSTSGTPCLAQRAPINDTSLTPSSNERERERASENGEEEENPKNLERRFRKWWATWPSYASDTEMTTRRAWLALTPQQRRDCEERTAAYLSSTKAIGRSFTKAGATYLSERAWERIGTASGVSHQAPQVFKAFSRAWQAMRIATLLGPEQPLPRMTAYLEAVVKAGGEKGETERRQWRMRYAWPKVTEMHNGFKPVHVSPELVAASEGFKSYSTQRDAAIVAAWKRLHERMGWPWPEMGSAEWICFPVTDGDSDDAVLAALDTFKETIGRGQGDEHAA